MVIGMTKDFTGNMPPEQRLAWSQAKTYVALGFDSCPIGGFDQKEYIRILKIPAPLFPVMLCPVGYAADKPHPKIRFPKEDIIF